MVIVPPDRRSWPGAIAGPSFSVLRRSRHRTMAPEFLDELSASVRDIDQPWGRAPGACTTCFPSAPRVSFWGSGPDRQGCRRGDVGRDGALDDEDRAAGAAEDG